MLKRLAFAGGFLLVLSACYYYNASMLTLRDDYSVNALYASTTISEYPIWEEPTPTRDVIGSYGDYKWTYPKIHNATRYAETRFMRYEMDKCGRRATAAQMCCTIGGSSTGGGEVSNGCKVMNFMAEFQPIPPRALFSLVDFLLAWRKANPHNLKFKMVFVGDSVTGQVFNAALCELARNNQVQSMTYDYFDYDSNIKVTTWRYEIAIHESHIRLFNAPGFDFCIMFIRQFKLTANEMALNLYFDNADVIMFGLGLHYAPDEGFRSRIETAFRVLRESRRDQPPIVMWFGAPKQHFRYALNDTQVDGAYTPGNHPLRFCGPLARVPPTHAWFQPLNTFAFDVVGTNLSIPASWIKWNMDFQQTSKQQLHVHFFPFAELTAPFYRNHATYNDDATKRSEDCTHPCGAPNLYEPFWDALYLIGNNRAEVRFPAGTQQVPPQITKHEEALYAARIMRELIGEML